MTDTLTPAERSRLMARIKGKNTRPEIAVRALLHRAGRRFRLHVRALPGIPDIVLPRHRVVVFVHGCFWHRHAGCKAATLPKTHRRFWTEKFRRNVANDRKHRRQLRCRGWQVVTVWECQLRRPERVLARIEQALPPRPVRYAPPESARPPLAAETRATYGRRPAAGTPFSGAGKKISGAGKSERRHSRRARADLSAAR